MKVWKVILAAVVIFAAGVVTGWLSARLSWREEPPKAPVVSLGPQRQRGELLDRMQRQLYLSPRQRERIETILHENHTRMKQLWETIAPQAQEEHRRVNERIRAELEPNQQTKFEEMLKRSPGRGLEDRRRREERRESRSSRRLEAPARTNAPTAETVRPSDSKE